MLLAIVIGLCLGFISGSLLKQDTKAMQRSLIICFVGAWLGNKFLANIGPVVYGCALIPTLLVPLFALVGFYLCVKEVRRESSR